jgi:two-component system chemotaxis response regulator CheB
MQISLQKLLSDHQPHLDVIGTARHGIEALEFLHEHSNDVDVILLDFFMPKMDGLETLKKIMELYSIPTIMISGADQTENADLYFKAMKLGAVDSIAKPSGIESLYVDQIEEQLVKKINSAFESRKKIQKIVNDDSIQAILSPTIVNRKKLDPILIEATKHHTLVSNLLTNFKKVILLGASTGGPSKIIDFIQNLHYSPNVAVIIIQHMPAGFTNYFAQRLNNLSEYPIHEASNGGRLCAGTMCVAPGDQHLKLRVEGQEAYIETNQEPRIWGVRPCIDYVMISAAQVFKEKCIGIVLTGMGRDGAYGIQIVKQYGGLTIAQNMEEALIDSMPKEAIKTGDIDHIMKVQDIIRFLNNNVII